MEGESVVTQTDSMPDDTPVETPPLASDFPTTSFEEWGALVAKVMNRGRPEDKQLSPADSVARLRSTTTDGIQLEPLYSAPDGSTEPAATGVPGLMPFTRGREPQRTAAAWDIRALHDDPEVDFTRREILADLERGATSIWLRVGEAGIAASDVAAVLTDVELDLAPVSVYSTDDQVAAARALVEAWASTEASAVSGNLGIDPFGFAALRGGDVDMAPLVTWTKETLERYPQVTPISVDVRPYHDAGAATSDELAFAVATALEYLRALEAEGVTPADVFDRIEFRVVATEEQFLSIAAVRALRRLWARIGEVLEVPESQRGARTHAVTSARMMTRNDPYVNMLRTTIAGFAAAVGNADAVTVLPFDNPLGRPTTFSRRISRNTQVILAEESSLGRVADPSGGSFYVEALTAQLAEKAWARFTEIEAAGGMRAALESGTIHGFVDAALAERDAHLADRTEALTGVSMFPNLAEPHEERAARPSLSFREGAVTPFRTRRDAEVFEHLRARAERAATEPTVLLVGLGSRRDFGAREGFATPFLAAGGIKVDLVEVTSADQIAARVADKPAKVAVLASSPTVYGEWGGQAAAALHEAGVEKVYLAGNPKELGDSAAAVDGNIAMGSNVVEITSGILDTLGVPPLTQTTQAQGAGA